MGADPRKIFSEKNMKKSLACIVLMLVLLGIEGQEEPVSNNAISRLELDAINEAQRGTSSREQKLIALEYILGAIERGTTRVEILHALEYLSLEGTQNKAREGGRVVNDYPDVRREAARQLGIMGTPGAISALIKICTVETEPMVLQETIRSLGNIGTNDNKEAAANAIVWVADKFNNSTAPDNLLALSSIEALDKIARRNNGITNPNVYLLLIKISEGSYRLDVKERAKQILLNFREYPQGMRG